MVLTTCSSLWWPRGAGWSRQQGELYWSIYRWHGMLHRILGQLPQDMELRPFLASEQTEQLTPSWEKVKKIKKRNWRLREG